jgi:hypothetical protein
MTVRERDHLAAGLKRPHVQAEPVQALDVQHLMTVESPGAVTT